MDETDENNNIEKSETNEKENLMTRFIGYFVESTLTLKMIYKNILGKTQLI
jgi:hypothetical protein